MNSATCLSKYCPNVVLSISAKGKMCQNYLYINVISANQYLKNLQYGKQQCTIRESLLTHSRNSEYRRDEN